MGDIIEVQVGQARLLVETMPVAGSEGTSALGRATGNVLGAFERAQDAIVEVASSTVSVIDKAAKRAARPDRLEVEFGLAFSAHGDIIVAGAAGHASLVVRLVYDRADQPGQAE